MANRRFIDFPIASTVGDSDIILIWQSGANKQTTKATFLSGLPENLEDLNDVVISGLTNGQILRYDSVTGKWENTDQGNLDLNDLNDVSIVSPSNGQVLVYNSSTSQWENSSGGYVPYVGAVTTVDLGAQGLRAGYVRFDTTVAGVPNEQGLMFWDADDETVDIILNGYTMKIGEDLFYPVKNQTGSTIAKGVAVRFNGTVGASGRLLIAPFIADGSVPSSRFMGVTAEEILNGEDGKVLYFGRVRGINTNAFNEGDILYASTTVAGGYQTAIPVAPNNIVQVAAVVTKSATVGTIFVRPTLGSNINKDEGVKITSVADKNLLQYQSGTSLWENKTLAQVIGGTSSQFVKGDGSLDSTSYQPLLTNPVTGTGASGQVAYFTGTSTISSESNLFWDATNDRLGIGGLTTSYKLQITNSSSLGITISTVGSDSANPHIQMLNGAIDTTIAATSSGLELTAYSAHALLLKSSNVERFRIFALGNVHIGPTPASDNGARLQVSGTANFSGSIQAATESNIVGTSVNARMLVTASGVANTVVGFNNSGSTTTGVTNNTAYLGVLQDFPLVFTTNSVERFRLAASTGAATFSSSITAGIITGDSNSTGVPSIIAKVGGGGNNGTYGFGNDTWARIRSGSDYQAMIFDTASIDRMWISASGNIGIGVNPKTWGSAFRAIQILNQASISAEADLIASSVNAFYDTSWKYIANGVATNYYQNNGQHVWRNATSGTAGNAITWSVPMTLTSGGNLLVGTTTDNGARLQVSGFGTYTVTGDNTRAIKVIGTTNRTGYLGHAFGTLFIQNNNYFNGSSYVFDDTSVGCANVTLGQDIAFQTGAANTNPSTKVYITNAGNVGIATISPTDYSSGGFTTLHINGRSGTGGGVLRLTSFDASCGVNIYAQSNAVVFNTTTASPFAWLTQDVTRMTLTSSGNVLIGTTTDIGGTLQVAAPALISVFQSTTSTQFNGLEMRNGGGSFYFGQDNSSGTFYGSGTAYAGSLYVSGAHPLVMFTSGTERMRITSVGRTLLLGSTSSAWENSSRALLELNNTGSSLLGLRISGNERAYFYHNNSNLYIEQMLAGGSIYVISVSAGVYLSAGATSWTANSDERLKNINGNIENAVDKLMTLRPVNYSWKNDLNQKENLGLIAQDVEKVFPQVIDINKLPSKPNQEQKDETEYLGVRYQELIPVLVKAIQELKQEINNLKN